MSRVTIFGPSIRFDHEWHVHAADCHHCRRYRGVEDFSFDADTQKDVVENIYCDIMRESGATWDEYLDDFKFFNCTKSLATSR